MNKYDTWTLSIFRPSIMCRWRHIQHLDFVSFRCVCVYWNELKWFSMWIYWRCCFSARWHTTDFSLVLSSLKLLPQNIFQNFNFAHEDGFNFGIWFNKFWMNWSSTKKCVYKYKIGRISVTDCHIKLLNFQHSSSACDPMLMTLLLQKLYQNSSRCSFSFSPFFVPVFN